MIPLTPSSFLCSFLLLYLVVLLLPPPSSLSHPPSSFFPSSSSLLSSLLLHLALVLQNYDFYLKNIVIFMKEVFLPFHLFENRLPGLEIIFDLVFIEFCGLLLVLWLVWEIQKPEKRKKRLLYIVIVFTSLILLNWFEASNFQKPSSPPDYISSPNFSNSVPSPHVKEEVGRRREEMKFEKNDEIGGRRMKWKEEKKEGENYKKRGEEEGRKIKEEEERRKEDEMKERGQENGEIDWVSLLGDFLEFLIDALA